MNHTTYDLSKKMNRTSCGCHRYLDVCTIRNKNLLIKDNQSYVKINIMKYKVLSFKTTLPYEVSYNNTFNTELIIIFIKHNMIVKMQFLTIYATYFLSIIDTTSL